MINFNQQTSVRTTNEATIKWLNKRVLNNEIYKTLINQCDYLMLAVLFRDKNFNMYSNLMTVVFINWISENEINDEDATILELERTSNLNMAMLYMKSQLPKRQLERLIKLIYTLQGY